MHRNLLAIAAAVAALSGQAATAEEWVCSGYMPSVQHPSIVALQSIGDELNRLTGGDVTVTCKTGGELSIVPTELIPATADGVIQLASTPFITGTIPVAGLFALPGLFGTEEELAKGLELAGPLFEEALDKLDLVYLGSYHYPNQVIFATGQIGSLADVKGKKIRVSVGEQSEFVKRFGGTPVTMGTPDVAPALQMGAIDGVLTAAAGGARYWAEVLKSNYELGTNFTISLSFVNKEAFEALTPEQQAGLKAFAAQRFATVSGEMLKENREFVEKFRADGMTVTPASAEDKALLVETMRDYWPAWAAERGDAAVTLLEQVRAALGK